MFDPVANVTIGLPDSINSSSYFQNKWDAFLDVVGKYDFLINCVIKIGAKREIQKVRHDALVNNKRNCGMKSGRRLHRK